MRSDYFNVRTTSTKAATHTINEKAAFLKLALNILIVAVVAAGVNLMIQLDVRLGNGISESSFTELSQLVCLAIAGFCFARIAHYRPDLKHALALACGLFAVMFIRENDNTLDVIVHGFWKYPALLVAMAAIIYALSAKKQIVSQMAVLANSQGVNLVVASIILLVVFSRLFGMSSLWQAIMTEGYVRLAKSIAEEGTELLCYALIALSSVKTLFEFKHQAK